MLRPDLCDYSDAYIAVKGRISVRGTMLYLDHSYQKLITHL